MRPVGETRIVTAAALCTKVRNCCLLAPRHLETPSFCQITQAEENCRYTGPVERSPADLKQPPAGHGLGANLDERADLLALDARKRSQDELQVVGMDKLKSR